MVKKSLSAVIHMLKADSESLINVDMSYSNIYFWVQYGSIFSQKKHSKYYSQD